jgi:protein FrlC
VSPETAEREAGARYMEACIDLASDLCCENVIVLGGYRRFGQSHAEAWSLACEHLAVSAAYAEPRGVRLVVEPTPADSNLLEQAGDCLRLIDESGVDVGVMLDTFHVLHRGDDIRESMRSAGGRLAYVHVSDEQRDAPGTHRDFSSLVHELRVLGYDGWLSMEIGFNRREPDPDALARAAFAYMSGLLAEVTP